MLPFFPEIYIIFLFLLSSLSNSQSIYEVLKSHGLPMGIFPKGIKNFTLNSSGEIQVHLDKSCNTKFENELHFDINVSGNLSDGKIGQISGISAQDLFLWFPVKEIKVDIPSSGLIYFDVGVVSMQFSLSSFENPKDCISTVQQFHQIQQIVVDHNTGSAR